MKNNKEPKWEPASAEKSGGEAVTLVETDRSVIEKRLKPDEIEQAKANLDELKKRQSGQKEVLTDQKSKTRSQDEAKNELHTCVISLRNMVKSANAPGNILKAFGVGEKLSKSVTGSVAAGNIIMEGYKNNTEWSNSEAGILEEDITEIAALIEELKSADGVQENAKFSRKATTLSRDALQRAVEDFVTKVSAIGVHVFRKNDPVRATLYEDLIPKSHRPPKEDGSDDGTKE